MNIHLKAPFHANLTCQRPREWPSDCISQNDFTWKCWTAWIRTSTMQVQLTRHVGHNILSHSSTLAHLHKCTHTLTACSHRPARLHACMHTHTPTCQCCMFPLLNYFFLLIFLFVLTVHAHMPTHTQSPIHHLHTSTCQWWHYWVW